MNGIRVDDGCLVYSEVPDPKPRRGEVIVSVRATAVNRADLWQAAGKYPPPAGASEILGLEGAGETAGGKRVFFLLPGGGYAEKVAVPRGMLMAIPENLGFEQAAAIPEAWFTAYLNLFLEGSLKAGETVLLPAAASGVGTAALQLAKNAGARVIATSRSDAKTARLRELGADLAINTTTSDLENEIQPRTVDLILDPVGGATFSANLRLLAPKGRLVMIATLAGGTDQLDLRQVLAKRLRIIGSTLRSRPVAEKIALTRSFSRHVLPGFADGTFKPVIDAVLPLSQAAEAHRRMAANENIGKLVLTTGP